MAETKVGRYTLVRELGRGAMGRVWEALDPKTDLRVALKVMRLPDDCPSARRRMLIERFRREAEVLRKLNHPNIVRILDVGEAGGQPYIAMELLAGHSLREELEVGGALPLDEAERIVVQVCRALHTAHRHGVVHRDVKPDNVMLLEGRREVRLTDFGIAKSLEDATLTSAGAALGTPAYMSPEQVHGWTVDGRSDIFSVGVILYELATRRRPFVGESVAEISMKIVEEDPMINVKLPRYLVDVIAKALRKDPEERYQAALDMAEDLESHRSPFAATRTAAPSKPATESDGTETALATAASLDDDQVFKELATRAVVDEEAGSPVEDFVAMLVSAAVGGSLGVLLACIGGTICPSDHHHWRTLLTVMIVTVHGLCFLFGLVMPRLLASRGYEPAWPGKFLGALGFATGLVAGALLVLGLPLGQLGPLIATSAITGILGLMIGSAFATV